MSTYERLIGAISENNTLTKANKKRSKNLYFGKFSDKLWATNTSKVIVEVTNLRDRKRAKWIEKVGCLIPDMMSTTVSN